MAQTHVAQTHVAQTQLLCWTDTIVWGSALHRSEGQAVGHLQDRSKLDGGLLNRVSVYEHMVPTAATRHRSPTLSRQAQKAGPKSGPGAHMHTSEAHINTGNTRETHINTGGTHATHAHQDINTTHALRDINTRAQEDAYCEQPCALRLPAVSRRQDAP